MISTILPGEPLDGPNRQHADRIAFIRERGRQKRLRGTAMAALTPDSDRLPADPADELLEDYRTHSMVLRDDSWPVTR